MSYSADLLPLLFGHLGTVNSLYYMHAHVSVRAAMYVHTHELLQLAL